MDSLAHCYAMCISLFSECSNINNNLLGALRGVLLRKYCFSFEFCSNCAVALSQQILWVAKNDVAVCSSVAIFCIPVSGAYFTPYRSKDRLKLLKISGCNIFRYFEKTCDILQFRLLTLSGTPRYLPFQSSTNT